MDGLKDVVLSLFNDDEEPDPRAYAHGVCRREGAARVVATVADLLARGADDWRLASHFLAYAHELPEVVAEIDASAALRAAFRKLLVSPETRTRLSAVGELGSFPEAFAATLQTAAAALYHRERDLLALVHVIKPDSTLVPSLLEEKDWLVRWSLTSATSTYRHEPEAAVLRARLAADPHPLIAGEAAQQLANIAARDAHFAALYASGAIKGWTFYTPGPDEGDAPCFSAIAKAFFDGWPEDKKNYTLEELRAFVLANT